jgi:hypothetical protein
MAGAKSPAVQLLSLHLSPSKRRKLRPQAGREKRGPVRLHYVCKEHQYVLRILQGCWEKNKGKRAALPNFTQAFKIGAIPGGCQRLPERIVSLGLVHSCRVLR